VITHVHMNGRVYDPVIGRFLAADPLLPKAGDSQSINPFGYASNRPLKLVDTTGHSSTDPTQEGSGSSQSAPTGDQQQPCKNYQIWAPTLIVPIYSIDPLSDPNADNSDWGLYEPGLVIGTVSDCSPRQVPKPTGPPRRPPASQGLPCSAASTYFEPSDRVEVELGYKNIKGITDPFGAHHAFVIVIDLTSPHIYASRAEPLFVGIGLPLLHAVSGTYNKGDFSKDYGQAFGIRPVGYLDAQYSTVTSYIDSFKDATNAAHITYTAITNSNSYAFSLVHALGLTTPSVPPWWVPGYDTRLLPSYRCTHL
jgi:hypothetical protein